MSNTDIGPKDFFEMACKNRMTITMIPDLTTLLFMITIPLLELLGIVTAVHAVMNVRTSQGAIAWALSLITFPFLTLPLYWIFGRKKFSGYVEAMRQGHADHARQVDDIICRLREENLPEKGGIPAAFSIFENLARMPFTTGNRVRLLIDGASTFKEMFADMEKATSYILLQYYIVNDDRLGSDLMALLAARAQVGIDVFFLYDEIGCHKLPGAYIDTLRAAGVAIHPFQTTRGSGNRFQLNFRNHRKITVIDGRTAYVGGHNIGDEYMGRNPKFGRWRDTHIKFSGPAVRQVQMSFVQDWYWATRQAPHLNWQCPPPHADGSSLLVLPSGPADDMETCSLMFVHAIHMARKRVWIASPYFIPNEAIIEALQIAALKGVDVRILLPGKPDHRIVYLAGFWYLRQLNVEGISFYRYQPGFLHQKVFLVDDTLAGIGTANADNRSFRLNFEITVLIGDSGFVKEVVRMLEKDFADSRLTAADEGLKRGPLFRFGVKSARLLSPIL